MPHFTPTEARIMAVLDDGREHTKAELHKCLWDDQADLNGTAVAVHICNLRDKLEPTGHTIHRKYVRNGEGTYRLMRVLSK